MPTRRARIRRRIFAKLPNWLKKNDFEVFAAVLGIVGGMPLVFGNYAAGGVGELLPPLVARGWGAVLVLGCIAVLIGVVRASQTVFPNRIFWMRVEGIGLTALAYFCYLYVVSVIGVNLSHGWTIAAIVLAFGLVCHVREAAINIELEQYRSNLGLEEKA